jgi:hypothetical protein
MELDGETVEVRRYRFGFRHALTLSAGVMLVLLAASAAILLKQRTDTEAYLHDTTRAVTAMNEHTVGPTLPEEFFKPPADASSSAWTRTKDSASTLVSAIKAAIREAPRIQNERMMTEAFAALNQSDPRQVRAFLATYGDNPYAEELGYIAAIRRAVAERRLYRSGEIHACGKCWCWRERPVPANDTTPTQ